MMEATKMLTDIPMESSKKFKVLNLKDAITIRNIAARLNQDFKRRLWNGHETTFTVKVTPNEKQRNYTVEVLRYPGRLEKKGGKYIRPIPAVTLL